MVLILLLDMTAALAMLALLVVRSVGPLHLRTPHRPC
jgi:hypothetical protein